jgi:hypothetical protein
LNTNVRSVSEHESDDHVVIEPRKSSNGAPGTGVTEPLSPAVPDHISHKVFQGQCKTGVRFRTFYDREGPRGEHRKNAAEVILVRFPLTVEMLM